MSYITARYFNVDDVVTLRLNLKAPSIWHEEFARHTKKRDFSELGFVTEVYSVCLGTTFGCVPACDHKLL